MKQPSLALAICFCSSVDPELWITQPWLTTGGCLYWRPNRGLFRGTGTCWNLSLGPFGSWSVCLPSPCHWLSFVWRNGPLISASMSQSSPLLCSEAFWESVNWMTTLNNIFLLIQIKFLFSRWVLTLQTICFPVNHSMRLVLGLLLPCLLLPMHPSSQSHVWRLWNSPGGSSRCRRQRKAFASSRGFSFQHHSGHQSLSCSEADVQGELINSVGLRSYTHSIFN